MTAAVLPIDSPAPTTASLPETPIKGLRWMAGLVVAYWAVNIGIGMTEINAFQKFLFRLGPLALLLVAFLGWWLTRRNVPLAHRLFVLVAASGAATLALAVRHPSIHGALAMSVFVRGVEASITAWVAWLCVARGFDLPTRRVGMVLVGALAWLWILLVRMDGFDGDGQNVFHWRWQPSGEEQFLAEHAEVRAAGRVEDADQAEPLAARAGDWPEFRGPARDAVVHGVTIKTDWNEHPPKQVWKRRVGPGWSSIVIVADRLFTQEQRGDEEAVVCYDAASGDELWAHTDEARFDEAMGGVGPRATPTFADGRLYALGATGILNAFDAASGELAWSRDVKQDGQGAAPIWGFSSSPLVVDGKVIVFAGGGQGGDEGAGASADEEVADAGSNDKESKSANDQMLIAYDAATGEPAWRAVAGSHSYSSAQLVTLDGVPQMVFVSDAELVSVDAATGKRLWDLPTNARQSSPAIQPHVFNDSELIISFSPTVGSLRVAVKRDGGAWRPEVDWVSRDLKPFFSDFVRVGQHAYGFDSKFFCCVDLETGKREWKGGRYGSGQVLLLADQPVLLVTTETGEAVLVAVNPEKHEELGRFQAVEGKTWNHPTVVGRRLYVRSAEEMACYEL